MTYNETVIFQTEEEKENFSKRLDRVKPNLIMTEEEEEVV